MIQHQWNLIIRTLKTKSFGARCSELLHLATSSATRFFVHKRMAKKLSSGWTCSGVSRHALIREVDRFGRELIWELWNGLGIITDIEDSSHGRHLGPETEIFGDGAGFGRLACK